MTSEQLLETITRVVREQRRKRRIDMLILWGSLVAANVVFDCFIKHDFVHALDSSFYEGVGLGLAAWKCA
jgi:hypothetical protein